MEDKKALLQKLITRNEVLKPIDFVEFNTEKELIKKKKKILKEREEYYNNLELIERLQWELKTPDEKKQYLKEEEISKLKREGKL